MIEILPAASFEATAQAGTGLVGTIGVRILDNQGATVTTRTTTGIVEYPAGSGVYQVTLTAPATAGQYTVMWDTGTVTPTTVKTEELVVSYTAPTPAGSTLFATHADLGVRLGITLAADEQTRADALVAVATGLIRADTGQTISLVEDDQLTLNGSYDTRIRLPERPVISISSVVLDGETITDDGWYLNGDELTRFGVWPTSERRFSIGGGWGDPSLSLVVTYSHGWAVIPGEVKAVCLEMVARVWMNPEAASTKQVGSTTASYPAQGMLLTPAESAAVRLAIRRQSASVALR